MRVPVEARGVPLSIEYHGPVPETIRSDPTRLRQILINLVGNAVKFTEKGSVRLVASLPADDGTGPRLCFEVVDTGIGMTREQLARLFHPFTQADASTVRKYGGTGLGLTISRRLSGLLGGTIDVVSAPGRGSTFRLVVPTGPLEGVRMLETPREVPSPPADAAPSAAKVTLNCRVLVAEDGPDNQRLICFLLRKAGAEVTLAENGQIALERALDAEGDNRPYDVILMDMQMPVMDGYAATRKLRELGYRGPIVALTAHALTGDRQECIRAGCDDYAAKPIQRDKLLEVVARYAGRQPRLAPPTPVHEAQFFLQSLVEKNKNLARKFTDERRAEARTELHVGVRAVPVVQGVPDMAAAFAAVLRDVTPTGLGLLVSSPVAAAELLVHFPAQPTARLLRTAVRATTPLEGGGFLLGLEVLGTVPRGEYPELDGVDLSSLQHVASE